MSTAIKYFLATRPAFLTITIFGCLIGFVFGNLTNNPNLTINLLALAMALLAHAAGNVLNDYFDHLNGSDLINLNRVSPFTGGSRFIQLNIFQPKKIYQFGILLLLLATILGLFLCFMTTWKLLPIGILGAMLLWMYSAPPFKLMSHGVLGEIAIALSWSLVVIGFSALQSGVIDIEIIPIAITYGLMVANILFLNQIPDINADKSSQKMTLAVQSNPKHLWIWYSSFPLCAYLLQIFAIQREFAPPQTLVTLLVTPIFWFYAFKLKNGEIDQSHLRKMIPTNILGVHLYALLLCVGCILNAKVPF
ncbi:prenyltransferase [Polynucleobacter sp. MWH-UH23A]|uniref:prenyltransferase n=1 Tax=Polynucleobacter sp. MWH-UH23A TaxID=1855613 RepID=UPI003364F930